MFRELLRLWRDECGAVSAEYVLLASLIAVVCVAGAALVGVAVGDSIANSADKFPP